MRIGDATANLMSLAELDLLDGPLPRRVVNRTFDILHAANCAVFGHRWLDDTPVGYQGVCHRCAMPSGQPRFPNPVHVVRGL